MRKYENLGCSPKNVESDLSNGIYGICHDEENWYVSQGSAVKKVPANSLDADLNYVEKKEYVDYHMGLPNGLDLYKYYRTDSDKNPVGFRLKSTIYGCQSFFGDLDCFNGYLFIPHYVKKGNEIVESRILVFSTDSFSYMGCQTLYKKDNWRFHKVTWCAVNPIDQCLYTSDSYVSDSFEGASSPVLAFKIDFNNIKFRRGEFFSCINKNGIKLERKVNVNSKEKVPYLLDAEVRGGCFDPFDTLYLSTNSYQEDYIRNKAYYLWKDKGSPIQSDVASISDWLKATEQIATDVENGIREREGVTAFALEREKTTSDDEYIQKTAYYIWKSKGSPVYQSEEGRKQDWLNAIGQISFAIQSGMAKADGAAYAGVAYVKTGVSRFTDDSIIDFTFNEKRQEEPKGITYWDYRRYLIDGDKGSAWYDGCLHVVKLKKQGVLTGANSFSLQNFALKNIETISPILNYDPKNLKIGQNQATGRYVVMDSSTSIKEFATYSEAKNALPVFAQFTSILLMGRCASNEKQYDLCYDILYDRVPNSYKSKLNGVKFETTHFDSFRVECDRNIVENKWNSDYVIVFDQQNVEDETYQSLVLPVHNTGLTALIDDIISNKSQFSKEKGGNFNYIKSSSNRQRDNLYWFD